MLGFNGLSNNVSKKIGISAIFLMGFASALHAAELSAPQQVIEDTSNELKLILKNDRDQLKSDPALINSMVDEVLIPRIDMVRVSKLVVGRQWKKTTPEQQTAFQVEFKQMLVRTYATAFNELDDWDVNFLSIRPGSNENNVVVRTKITRNGPPVAVDYRMIFKQETWKVYDVTIEGMSLITNYRSTFSRVMRTAGMDGLLEHLAETNQQKSAAASNVDEFQKVSFVTK